MDAYGGFRPCFFVSFDLNLVVGVVASTGIPMILCGKIRWDIVQKMFKAARRKKGRDSIEYQQTLRSLYLHPKKLT